jgi:mono/diheme cytochrome c family protein
MIQPSLVVGLCATALLAQDGALVYKQHCASCHDTSPTSGAGGFLYVNSGYGQWGGMPGNVLLAFSVDGK